MSYDELELDTLGDRKTALFLIMSDTDSTFNFVIAMLQSQLFNLLCDKADDEYGGKLPVHVRCLLDEFANIGQIPQFEKLIATIRSREISASIILQSQSQLKAIYKDAAEIILDNADSTLFLGGRGKNAKDISENLGRETIDSFNTSENRGTQVSHGLNYQKLGKEGLELVGQTQCTSEVFQVSDIENAVFQALKKELSLLDVLYGDIQKEEQGLKEAHKKASRRKILMEQKLKNLKGEKMRMYEEYAAGTLSLDTYKQKKQECDRRISEVQEQIEQSKAEESTKSVVPGTVRAAAEQAENFLNGTRLTASMVSAFIENVFVYDGGRIVVRFKYEQSIQNAVKALHTD